jgi:hypothetical protein
MELELKPEITFEGMSDLLTKECPNYKVKLLKNPVARFQYILVEKSAFVGIWIRIMEDKGKVKLINTMPSTLARIPFLGLLVTLALFAFTNPAQAKVNNEVGEILMKAYNTNQI